MVIENETYTDHSASYENTPQLPTNGEIAAVLSEVGYLLETQGAIAFRVQAYRRAAEMIEQMDCSLAQLVQRKGLQGLVELPTIGRSIAKLVEQLVRTGRSTTLQRLRGDNVSERLFATVPDIGPKLARQIHETLGIESLFELQAAANDGRLSHVKGMGQKRIRAVRESLAGRLGLDPRETQHSRVHRAGEQTEIERMTPIGELLDVDREYRRLAKAGKLIKIAPRQFNPAGVAWLPILHTERQGRHYTALYSNTARAHELNTIRDWVVIYREDHHVDGRWTAITSQFGPLKGQRIIRGREQDCLEHYRQQL